MRLLAIIGGWLALICQFPSVAHAADGKQPIFRLMWEVEPQAANDEILQLKEGQAVTSARLLPKQLLITRADVKTADGKMLIVGGTELVRAVTNAPGALIACTISTMAVGPLESFFMTTEKYGCFIDDNQDGAFDRFFTRGGSNVGLLPNDEKIPKKTVVLTDGRYQVGDSAASKSAPKLVFKYANYAFLSKWIIFQACISFGDWRCIDLVDTYGLRLRDLPGTFDAYGGQFHLLEKNEAGVKVRMTKPFVSSPMSFSY